MERNLLKGSLIAHNSLINSVSKVIPFGFAVVAIPLLIDSVGEDNFGIILLVWALIGYGALFDFGLANSVIRFTSLALGEKKTGQIKSIFFTGVVMVLAISAGLVLIITSFSSSITELLFRKAADIAISENAILYLILTAIPFVLITSLFSGILASFQSFKTLSLIQITNGILNYTLPLVVAIISGDLFLVLLSILVNKIIILILHTPTLYKILNNLDGPFWFSKRIAGELFHFGKWISVSNVLSQVLVHTDKILIASFISFAALAYYTTPLEIISKLIVFPASITAVLYPAITQSGKRLQEYTHEILMSGNVIILMISFPALLLISLFSNEVISLWIDAEFAAQTYMLLKIMVIGYVLNGASQLFLSHILSTGNSRSIAGIYAVQSIFYVPVLYVGLTQYGLVGGAIVLSMRLVVDFFLLYAKSRQKTQHQLFNKPFIFTVLYILVIMTAAVFVKGYIGRSLFFISANTFFFTGVYFFVMPDKLKNYLLQQLKFLKHNL